MKVYQILLVITISFGFTSAGVIMGSIYETDSKSKIRQNYDQTENNVFRKSTPYSTVSHQPIRNSPISFYETVRLTAPDHHGRFTYQYLKQKTNPQQSTNSYGMRYRDYR